MNSFINTLSDTVLSKNLESCDLAELETLSQTHPYSSALQLLYAQKLQASGNADYHKQLQKTLLYYNNPLFIKYLIETKEGSLITRVDEVPVIAEHPAPSDEQDIIEEEVQTATVIETKPEAFAPAATIQIPEEAPALATQQASLADGAQATDDEGPEPVEDLEEDDIALPPLPVFKFEPIDPAKAELSFTPYHTVDYFAAQGIKLGEELNTGDRFGTQLKSFTSWLKQMKRLPGATAKGNISITEEKSIEQMAEQSLQGENADTEAMAQVWAQQGNAKKAIEIYKKLSLQIPAKSAYFAAKIDHLKK